MPTVQERGGETCLPPQKFVTEQTTCAVTFVLQAPPESVLGRYVQLASVDQPSSLANNGQIRMAHAKDPGRGESNREKKEREKKIF